MPKRFSVETRELLDRTQRSLGSALGFSAVGLQETDRLLIEKTQHINSSANRPH
jgi:hypothetical protein